MPSDLYTKLQTAIAQLRTEMPDVASVPIAPGAANAAFAAQTTPAGVVYSPDKLAHESQGDVESTFAHELTHARQFQAAAGESFYTKFKRMLTQPTFEYAQDPAELEAYQFAADRAVAHGQPAMAQPSFSGTSWQQGDLALPTPRKPR